MSKTEIVTISVKFALESGVEMGWVRVKRLNTIFRKISELH